MLPNKISISKSPEAANKVAGNFIKKETLTQVFSCEFFKISKNTFYTEHPRANASEPQHTDNKLAVYNRPVWPFYVTSNTNNIINSRGYHRNLALYQQTFEIFFCLAFFFVETEAVVSSYSTS